MSVNQQSAEVTALLDGASHPLRDGIDLLRRIILSSKYELTEGIKWNGPNYSHGTQDQITMRLSPPTKLQVIFHRGAKVQEQPQSRLLLGDYDFLVWKENDRAVATFTTVGEVDQHSAALAEVVDQWIEATGG